ncbi:OVARIAN TUMOR DOMAIN-containing deubiquitinating enzyme 9-like [Branchiostoma floridae]|uniref:OVARIAN TUMOR DOMAIN-containing deubiquitinating enzyme 9-like n=1 Tax=Branchiostoma floridae TaxID=7739 RepID=A0A9J7LA95_BRAFL|nr:OVARIAN TUMOR DOMAIN-containing deubiquitinating enzyme 9-like [Branchiostoma floridae]
MSKTCSHVVIEHPQEDNGYGNDDMQQMKANLAAENLVVRDFITADGNCQFSAVSDQVSRLKRGYMTANCLREIVVSYLKNIPVPEPSSEHTVANFVQGDFDAYLDRMAVNGEWGDHVTLQAMANLLNLPIHVVSSSYASRHQYLYKIYP